MNMMPNFQRIEVPDIGQLWTPELWVQWQKCVLASDPTAVIHVGDDSPAWEWWPRDLSRFHFERVNFDTEFRSGFDGRKLHESRFIACRFDGNFGFKRCPMHRAVFQECRGVLKLDSVYWYATTVEGCYFTTASIKGGTWIRSKITDSTLHHADFVGASIKDCALVQVTMPGASISGSDICGGAWVGGDFSFLRISESWVGWFKLSGAPDFTGLQLERMRKDFSIEVGNAKGLVDLGASIDAHYLLIAFPNGYRVTDGWNMYSLSAFESSALESENIRNIGRARMALTIAGCR